MLYIDEPDVSVTNTLYSCHLLLGNVFNDTITLRTNAAQFGKYKYNASCKIVGNTSPLPDKIRIKFNLLTGKLSITGKDDTNERITYAILYRDNTLI